MKLACMDGTGYFTAWPRTEETRNVLPDEGVMLSGRCLRPRGWLHGVRELKCKEKGASLGQLAQQEPPARGRKMPGWVL